jgi:hypothetical protein
MCSDSWQHLQTFHVKKDALEREDILLLGKSLAQPIFIVTDLTEKMEIHHWAEVS